MKRPNSNPPDASRKRADDEAGDEAGERDGGAAGRSDDHPLALVTGSTSGLGREVARRLAHRGFRILVHGRNRERGHTVVREIEEDEGAGTARFLRADFASLDEVRKLADRVRADHDRLDVLVNNAGIYPDGRETSEDGHELGLQVNHLAHFLLTLELLPLLRESDDARIVNVASGAQRPVDLDDPMMERGYSDSRSYAQSKLAQILFTFELAERLHAEEAEVGVNALHPATYMDTRMVRGLGVEPRSAVEEGAEAVMRLITDPEVGSRRYFNGTRPARADEQAYDDRARAELWRLSRELTGV